MRLSNIRALAEILGSRVLIVLFAACTDVVIARAMAISDRGAFSALQGSLLLLAGLCTLGLEYGFMLAPNLPSPKKLLRCYLRALPVLLVFGAALIVAMVLRYRLGPLAAVATAVIGLAEIVTIVYLPLLLQYHGSARFGLVRVLRRGLLCAALGIAFIALKPQLVSLSLALVLHAGSWLAAASYAVISLRRVLGSGPSAEPPSLVSLWRAGAGIFFAKYAERAQSRVGLLLLGLAGLVDQAAFFAVAALTVDLSIFVAGSLSIAVITRREDSALLGGRMLLGVGIGVMLLNVVIGALVWFFAAPVIAMIYGEAYLPVVVLVRWLMPALVVYGAYPLLSTHLLKLGQSRLVLVANYAALGANVAYAAIRLPAAGPSGALVAVQALLIGLAVNVIVVLVAVIGRSRR